MAYHESSTEADKSSLLLISTVQDWQCEIEDNVLHHTKQHYWESCHHWTPLIWFCEKVILLVSRGRKENNLWLLRGPSVVLFRHAYLLCLSVAISVLIPIQLCLTTSRWVFWVPPHSLLRLEVQIWLWSVGELRGGLSLFSALWWHGANVFLIYIFSSIRLPLLEQVTHACFFMFIDQTLIKRKPSHFTDLHWGS